MNGVVPGAARDLFAGHYVDPGAPDAAETIAARLSECGLVTVDGLDSREAVLAFTARHLAVAPHRDSDPDGLTVIHDTGRHHGRPGFAGLGAGALAAHTERSGITAPPRLMLNVCVRPSEDGGVCLLTDGRAVHTDLTANHPEAAEALSEHCAAFFGGQDGVFAAVFAPAPGSRITVRLRLDDLVWWNPLAAPHIPALTETIARHQQSVHLDAGDAYLIDNWRWLHARTAFTGPRRLYRALGAPSRCLTASPSTPPASDPFPPWRQPDEPHQQRTARPRPGPCSRPSPRTLRATPAPHGSAHRPRCDGGPDALRPATPPPATALAHPKRRCGEHPRPAPGNGPNLPPRPVRTSPTIRAPSVPGPAPHQPQEQEREPR